jgi:hypothetical protein
MAPPEIQGMAAFGGGGDGGNEQQQGGGTQGGAGDDNSHVPIFGQEDGDESGALDDILKAFGGSDDADGEFDDTTQDEDEGLSDVPQEQVEALNTQIVNAIKQMKIPDDAIPADFDFSDRTQVTALMNRTVQAAVAQSLNVVFKPVQLALSHMAKQIDTRVDSKIQGSREQFQAQSILEDLVPEINDPKHAPLVKNLDATLKANGKKPKERATTIRKMLNQMGIKSNAQPGSNRRASNPNSGNQASVRTGTAALDSFFGAMPKFK